MPFSSKTNNKSLIAAQLSKLTCAFVVHNYVETDISHAVDFFPKNNFFKHFHKHYRHFGGADLGPNCFSKAISR